jgi:hypothetical protein
VKITVHCLSEVPHLFDRFVEIGQAVSDRLGFGYNNVTTSNLKAASMRGHWVSVAADRKRVVGFYIIGPADSFLLGGEWMAVKSEIVSKGFDLDKLQAAYMAYILPEYWKSNGAKDFVSHDHLRTTAVKASGFPAIVHFSVATDEIEQWCKRKPGAVVLDARNSDGRMVILQRLSDAA